MKKNNFIKYFKDKLFIKTSEELLDINAQPEQQCIKIDRVQKEIKSCIEEIEYFCKDLKNIENAESLVANIERSVYRYMYHKTSELEDLRMEIENIRQWGQDWKDLSKDLLNELENEDEFFRFLSNKCQIKYDEILNNGK